MLCKSYWKNFLKILSNLIFHFVVDVGKETDILALKLWAKKEIHFFERLIWMLILVFLITWAFTLTGVQINRYEKSPTVMAVERDYSGGISSIPALTICFDPVLNEAAYDKFILEKWNITSTDSEYLYFNSFLNSVLNTRAETYQFLAKFSEDQNLYNIDLHEVVRELQNSYVKISSNSQMKIGATTTERGLCFLINSALIPWLSLRNTSAENLHNVRPWPNKKQKPKQQQSIFELNIGDGSGNIQVHSTYEFPTLDAQVIQFKESQDIKATFKVIETVASDDLRKLSIYQRKCIFPDEVATIPKVYSQNVCLARCRAKLALKLCQCIPFFYEVLEKSNCTVKDFECLKIFEWPTWSVSACNCPSPCMEIHFMMQTVKRKYRIDDLNLGTRFRLEIIPPKVRKRRSVVFGFGDLLVSFGGVWTLLLGFSLVTIVQFVSVAVFHLLNNLQCLCNNKTKHVSRTLKQKFNPNEK